MIDIQYIKNNLQHKLNTKIIPYHIFSQSFMKIAYNKYLKFIEERKINEGDPDHVYDIPYMFVKFVERREKIIDFKSSKVIFKQETTRVEVTIPKSTLSLLDRPSSKSLKQLKKKLNTKEKMIETNNRFSVLDSEDVDTIVTERILYTDEDPYIADIPVLFDSDILDPTIELLTKKCDGLQSTLKKNKMEFEEEINKRVLKTTNPDLEKYKNKCFDFLNAIERLKLEKKKIIREKILLSRFCNKMRNIMLEVVNDHKNDPHNKKIMDNLLKLNDNIIQTSVHTLSDLGEDILKIRTYEDKDKLGIKINKMKINALKKIKNDLNIDDDFKEIESSFINPKNNSFND